ncbi:T9SS-dependent choice-of-anchor J family protein [Hymenobacter convexus]|uniref:T9SS-dependent choice-of-anchor J family protein n=1 Tax=Hymenobacter sp. CA1UV-4 TaxID=3063782 RepID=UPI002713489C|nr:choice-of-anchor J domain-containing protein [Hymenobacter sp. CA1UV-4]MDO7853665.1 choice-of-anchor J domain-containing protein [Hymenobacter sp. CA1UV-4]
MNHHYDRTGPTSRLRHWALAALLATGAVGSAQAQALNFPIGSTQNAAGTFTDLGTTGTAISTSSTDDANSAEQLIGFNFSYNGATMDRFILNTNGFLKLGSAAGMTAPTVALYTAYAEFNQGGALLGTAAADVNLLAPFNYDLLSGTSTAEYRVATTGTAPNRVCTVQWKNVADKAQLSLAGGTSIPTQYSNLTFQVKMYEANGMVEFVYGPVTPAPAANNNFKYAQVGIKGSGNATDQIVRVTKGSVTLWNDLANVFFANGPVTVGATGAFNFRQSVPPDNGRTFRFVPTQANDAAVTQIYTLNQLAVPGAAPHVVRAVITNSGTNALTNVVATLNVTGANTFTNTQTVASVAAGASTTVTFAAYTPANQGTNTVTVSVPADDNSINNSKAETQVVNTSTFSYISLPATNSGGGVGFPSGSELGFAAKYTLNTARSVTAVRAFISDFPTSGTTQKTTVGETLYGVVVDATTGAILGRSPNFVVTTADANTLHTFTLSAPVTVPAGDFLVGMIQISPASNGTASFYPMGVQDETPTRPGTFFNIAATGGAPYDVSTSATPRNNKYMLEAVTAAPANNDLAVNEIQGYGSIAVPVGNPFSLRAVVRNAGVSGITAPVTATLTISGANTVTQTQTLTSLAVGATATLNFSNITLPNVGANTVTVTLPNDDVNGNNTVSQAMATSATRFSYIVGTAPATNALGVPPLTTAARTVAFCGKFTVNTPRDVTAVRAFIYNDPNLLPTAANGQRATTVYGVVVNATTGAVLARSADYVLTAADLNTLHTFSLSTSVPAGDFLVGMAQVTPVGATTAGVFPMGVQDETPARTGLFYTVNVTTATASAPQDVAANNVRFMLEAETAPPATCPVPTALASTGSTPTTASFSFTAAAGATGYQIVYGPQGFTPGGANSTTSPTFTGTTYTVTGLSGGTTYEFYIRTICSATDQSAYAGPVRVITACTPPVISTFPYNQSFDVITAGQALPCGITVVDSNNDGFTWRATGTVDASLATGNIARSAPNAMVYSYNSTDTTVPANDWFFSPALTLTNTQTYRVAFYYRAAAGYPEGLEVKYGTAATAAGQTSTIYTNTSITNTLYRPANNTTNPVVADITVPAGTYYVGFHAISAASSGFLAVDDLTISAGPLATSAALKRAVSVFPNPSNTGVFNLEIHGANAKQALTVEVTNMLGQRVYTGTAKDNFQNSVNLSSLQSGIYSITVRNGQEYTQQQISIVK